MIGLFKINEDAGWGPSMMFGIPGPGPKSDTKGIPSDKEKEEGIQIKDMTKIPTFKKYTKKIEEEEAARKAEEDAVYESNK